MSEKNEDILKFQGGAEINFEKIKPSEEMAGDDQGRGATEYLPAEIPETPTEPRKFPTGYLGHLCEGYNCKMCSEIKANAVKIAKEAMEQQRAAFKARGLHSFGGLGGIITCTGDGCQWCALEDKEKPPMWSASRFNIPPEQIRPGAVFLTDNPRQEVNGGLFGAILGGALGAGVGGQSAAPERGKTVTGAVYSEFAMYPKNSPTSSWFQTIVKALRKFLKIPQKDQ